MAVFTGVRDGDPSVLPALLLTLSILLDSGAGRQTFQLKAFKLTVCKLFRRIKIYQRKGQLEGLKPFVNPSWHILEPFLTRAKKQIQLCSPCASLMTLRNFCNVTMHLRNKRKAFPWELTSKIPWIRQLLTWWPSWNKTPGCPFLRYNLNVSIQNTGLQTQPMWGKGFASIRKPDWAGRLGQARQAKLNQLLIGQQHGTINGSTGGNCYGGSLAEMEGGAKGSNLPFWVTYCRSRHSNKEGVSKAEGQPVTWLVTVVYE